MYWSIESQIKSADEILYELEWDEREKTNTYELSEDITESIDKIEESIEDLKAELDRRKTKDGNRSKFIEIYELVRTYYLYSIGISHFGLIVGVLLGAWVAIWIYGVYDELYVRNKSIPLEVWNYLVLIMGIPFVLCILFLFMYIKKKKKYKRNHLKAKKEFETYMRENPNVIYYFETLLYEHAVYKGRIYDEMRRREILEDENDILKEEAEKAYWRDVKDFQKEEEERNRQWEEWFEESTRRYWD